MHIMCVMAYEVRGQLVGIGSVIQLWVLGVKLRVSALLVNALPTEPSPGPLYLTF